MDMGIVRTVDNLGRIVIPKEIRKTQNICEDDPFLICFENGDIVLRRYSPYGKYRAVFEAMASAIEFPRGIRIALCDTQNFISSAMGANRANVRCENKPLSNAIKFAITKSKDESVTDMAEGIKISSKDDSCSEYYAKKIYVMSPNKGGIVVISDRADEASVLSQEIKDKVKFIFDVLKKLN